MSNQKLNILVVGGSRHIGYHAALRFLEAGANVTFLLRNPNCFDGDDAIQKHVSSGKARLVKGDALILEDVRKAWEEAETEKPVDVLLFTVGFTGNPKFHVTKGFQIDPPNIVTQCLLNCLCTMPRSSSTASIPTKVIITSASGVSPSSRKATPLVLRLIMYSYLISGPLADKLCCERIISYCAEWEWTTKSDGVPDEENILGKGWKDREGFHTQANSRML